MISKFPEYSLTPIYIICLVHSPKRSSCSGPEIVHVGTKEQFISSQDSAESSCGTHNSPWVLEAKLGQKIKVELQDFSWDPEATNHIGCGVKYGYILDVGTDDIINICGGTTRENELYTSTGNRLQIVLESNDKQKRFLLRYKGKLFICFDITNTCCSVLSEILQSGSYPEFSLNILLFQVIVVLLFYPFHQEDSILGICLYSLIHSFL